MAEFWDNYLLFLAQTATVLAAVVLIILLLSSRGDKESKERDRIVVKKLNRRFEVMADALREHILDKKQFKSLLKQRKDRGRRRHKPRGGEEGRRPRCFVLDFHGDIKASAVSALREEITAVLLVAEPGDEVFVRLESGGGMVHAYGLAASQLRRIKDRGVRLVVAVDKVAASGGYMMACVADRIVAAPFAIVGSIGVVAQIPNFHRLLKKNDVDFELMTAGKFKRTLTLFGENTDEARAKFQQELEDTHRLFKDFINQHRPSLDVDKVSTGEYWPGIRAKELDLVDELCTSDDFLVQRSETADLYQVSYTAKTGLASRLSGFFSKTADSLYDAWMDREQRDRLP